MFHITAFMCSDKISKRGTVHKFMSPTLKKVFSVNQFLWFFPMHLIGWYYTST
jgi:hypothetical protein